MKKAIIAAAAMVLIVVLSGAISGVAMGHINGGGEIVGLYKTGCAPCHGRQGVNNYEGNLLPDGSQAPYQLTIDGNHSTTVGKTETYTVHLVALPMSLTGGIDVAIEDSNGNKAPGLSPGLNTQKVEWANEITHFGLFEFLTGNAWEVAAVNGRIWQFTWTPPAPGTYTLYVAANAANGDTKSNSEVYLLWSTAPDGLGDAWYRYWSGGQVGVGRLGFTITVT